MAATGLFIAATGICGGLSYFLQLFIADGPAVDSVVVGAAFAVLGVVLGGALAWQGSRAFLNYDSRAFNPLSIWVLILLYTVVIVVGQLIIYFDFFPAVTFSPFHILAAALPPFIILAFAGRALKSAHLRWRDVIMHVSGGAFLATSIAFMAEIVIGLVVLLFTVMATALTPGGRNFIEQLAADLQNPLWLENPDNVQQILLFPPVVVAVVLVFVFLAPAVEELIKPVSVALMSYRRPSQIEAWVWGLAAGAGFALIENLFNTVLALDAWLVVMLLRVGGTLMHCIGSGLIALGWQQMLTNRRPWRLIGAYVVAVTIHALWNGAVVGITGVSLATVGATGETAQMLGGAAVIVFGGLLIALSLGLLVALVLMTKRLQRAKST